MKQLGLVLLPPGTLDHHRVIPSIKFTNTHLYTWVQRGTVRVKYLANNKTAQCPWPGLQPGLHSIWRKVHCLMMRPFPLPYNHVLFHRLYACNLHLFLWFCILIKYYTLYFKISHHFLFKSEENQSKSLLACECRHISGYLDHTCTHFLPHPAGS